MGKTHKKIELLDKEELLLEAEGWAVIQDIRTGRRKWQVYGTHETCTVSHTPTKKLPEDNYFYGAYCWEIDNDPVCVLCDEPVPDGIQAIIHLRSWGLQEVT